MIRRYASATSPRRSAQRDLAYRVPWRIEREHAPTFRIVNESRDTLRGVSLSLTGSAMMLASPPRLVAPGDGVVVTIKGRDLARDTVLIVRWFRSDGGEYLWSVSF
jgi:hypothetical protein